MEKGESSLQGEKKTERKGEIYARSKEKETNENRTMRGKKGKIKKMMWE